MPVVCRNRRGFARRQRIPVRVTRFAEYPNFYIQQFIGFDHKHFAIARWPQCKALQLLAQPKENAPWHDGGPAAGVFPYRSAEP